MAYVCHDLHQGIVGYVAEKLLDLVLITFAVERQTVIAEQNNSRPV